MGHGENLVTKRTYCVLISFTPVLHILLFACVSSVLLVDRILVEL